MARLVGIDIRDSQVRAAVLQVRYRQLVVEQLVVVERGSTESLEEALRSVFASLGSPIDGVATAMDGERSFIRRLVLPPTAAKQLGEILPYELEAQVPVDLGELIYDYRLLKRGTGDGLVALAAAARTEDVSAMLALVRSAGGPEPERIGCGALPLSNVVRFSEVLRGPGPIGVVDLGGATSDVVVFASGEPVFARTISQGVSGLPGSAPTLTARLRQTFAAVGGDQVVGVYLTGAGVEIPGAEAYLAYELNVPVAILPKMELQGKEADRQGDFPKFAKAIGLAASLSGRHEDLNLRQGPLEFQRGFGFFKEKLPLLAGLVVSIGISFGFATWAELRSLARDNEVLTQSLGELSQSVLGTRTEDPSTAQELLSSKLKAGEDDPMPHMDAYDVILELSKVVPDDVTHDIEEFDFQRNKLRITGIVGTTGEAQRIATSLGEHECLKDTKIAKVTQVINSDRQKYVLEADVSCPLDQKKAGSTETKR